MKASPNAPLAPGCHKVDTQVSGRPANTRGRCHHKSSYASTTPKTVYKPQSEPKTLWRARCFSGMRWSGCGTALQHPSKRSCVRFADARQHRGRAWYIEVTEVTGSWLRHHLARYEVRLCCLYRCAI